MILPTKGIHPQKALIAIGADVLRLLEEDKTVSRLWDEFRKPREKRPEVTFDWFILSLDLLFIVGAITYDHGRLLRNSPHDREIKA